MPRTGQGQKPCRLVASKTLAAYRRRRCFPCDTIACCLPHPKKRTRKAPVKAKGPILLLITAILWGMAFVAQTTAADNVGPFTFNASRNLIGALFLSGVIAFRKKAFSMVGRSPAILTNSDISEKKNADAIIQIIPLVLLFNILCLRCGRIAGYLSAESCVMNPGRNEFAVFPIILLFFNIFTRLYIFSLS